MDVKTERIPRLGYLFWNTTKYIQEIERAKFVTEEKAEVEYYNAVEAAGEKGTKINFLV